MTKNLNTELVFGLSLLQTEKKTIFQLKQYSKSSNFPHLKLFHILFSYIIAIFQIVRFHLALKIHIFFSNMNLETKNNEMIKSNFNALIFAWITLEEIF